MTTFVTADTHFGHHGILKHRPFDSVEEMDFYLIDRWNSVVKPSDVVWHLGDFEWKPTIARMSYLLHRLNGSIHLIRGNHDPKSCAWYESVGFASCHDMCHLLHDDHRIHLCHYPIEKWRNMGHGALHFHGHSHGKSAMKHGRIDVGVDGILGMRPITMKEAVAIAKREANTFACIDDPFPPRTALPPSSAYTR